MPAISLDRFFRNPTTGEVVVAQWPNLPLTVWLAATLARAAFDPDGAARTATSAIGTVSLGWWSVAEVRRGDSPFRRVLGGVVLVGLVTRLVLR